MMMSSSSTEFPGYLLDRAHESLPIAAAASADDKEEKEPTCGRRRRDLSEDELMDILVRLPIKSLMRFKSVSRFWYHLITCPYFVSGFDAANKTNGGATIYCESLLQLSRRNTSTYKTKITFGLFDDDVPPIALAVRFKVSSLEIVGCCAGLVCLSFSVMKNMFAIWNPNTRQVSHLPLRYYNPTGRCQYWLSSGFCFDPVASAHKITNLTLFAGKTDFEANLRVKVNEFTLISGSDSWTEKTIYIPFHFHTGLGCFKATCVNKYLFWASIGIQYAPLTPDDGYILCFDMVAQIFTRIELPCPVKHPIEMHRIMGYNETIAIVVDKWGTPFEVWVLNDCGGPKQAWSSPPFYTPSESLSEQTLLPAAFFTKDGVCFWVIYPTGKGTCLLDPYNGEIVKNSLSAILEIGYATYRQSLASVPWLAS